MAAHCKDFTPSLSTPFPPLLSLLYVSCAAVLVWLSRIRPSGAGPTAVTVWWMETFAGLTHTHTHICKICWLTSSAVQGKAGKERGVKGQDIIKKKPQQFWHMILHNKLWCIQIAPVEQLKYTQTNKLPNTSIHCVYATQLFKARTKTINELSQTMPGQPEN